jgi:hypothetical protein
MDSNQLPTVGFTYVQQAKATKMKYALMLSCLLWLCSGTGLGQSKDQIENKLFCSELGNVWDALKELLVRHQWRFDVVDRSSGFIRTKAYSFRQNDLVYPTYVQVMLTNIDQKRTKVHISFQLDKEYRDAVDTDLRIGRLTIAQKIHQYFAELDSVLEQSRIRCLERQDERKEILGILEKYVDAEESHDVEGQVRWFHFPYTFARDDRAFKTLTEREFREVLREKARKYHERYGTDRGIISLFNRCVKFFGQAFAVASFDWEYALPDGRIHYGRGDTFFSKQDSSWMIVMQYDMDK